MSSAKLTKLKRKAADLEQKKEFEKALALYIQVIDEGGRDLDDADLQLYNRVGDLLMRQNNVSEGLSYYEKAVDMYAERGYLNNAIALCNKILRQSPARTAVYYKLGKISARKGFKSDARKNFLEYADRVQKAGDLDEAFRSLKEFADLCPDQDDVRLMLADLLTKEKRTGEALEQLEQLYSKLEAEGRAAEARATLSRIKAIDPEVTPRSSGTWVTQKSNDLVFLDVDDADFPGLRGEATSRERTPVVPQAPIESVDVSGVGALQGLTITFLPDEGDSASSDDGPGTRHTLEGLDATVPDAASVPAGFDLGALPGLVPQINELAAQLVDSTPLPVVDHAEWATPDEVVTPIDGLATVAVSLTGAHPSMGPLLDEPPLTGEEFGELRLASQVPNEPEPLHDLALASSLPQLTGDPLTAERDAPPLAEPIDLDADSPASVARLGMEFAAEDLVAKGDGEPSGFAIEFDEVEAESVPAEGAMGADAAPLPGDAWQAMAESRSDAPAFERDASGPESPGGDDAATGHAPLTGAIGEHQDAATGNAPLTGAIGEHQDAAARHAPRETGQRGELPKEGPTADRSNASDGENDGRDAPAINRGESALDIAALRAGLALESQPNAVSGDEDADDPTPRTAFEEERVELPMIDLASTAFTEEEPSSYDDHSSNLEELLSTHPSFGDGDDATAFEPAPLDIAPNPNTDEWSKPEVLIDGEWRDEHMGDLVSGETFVVGDRRAPHPPEKRSTFDDLSAAMLYDGEDRAPGDAERTGPAPPADAASGAPGNPTRGGTLSFGGTEAQLRRRLELEPGNTALRRQLGEALLDVGERDEGLNELETAVLEYELRADFSSARDIVDVILRIVPMSVRHHQKRVEYAVRSSDRQRLVEAYTELADALFRCGEPDKAHVVYARVLELAPSNERARFALSMLADDPGLPRSSDEMPAIDMGILPGPGAFPLPPFPAEADAEVDGEQPVVELPYLSVEPVRPDGRPVSVQPGAEMRHAAPVEETEPLDPLDAEVEAAFADDAPEADDARRPTGELVAIEEWASVRAEPFAPRASVEQRVEQRVENRVEQRVENRVEQRVEQRVVERSDDEFVDLGEWLRGDQPERSTRMVAADVAPTGDEGADFAEMLRRFKQGVAANVEDEDFASHYDLGVAFKEMGLVDEAIAQFQKALRGPDHRVRAYEALGQCFVEKGQYQVALALLQRAADGGAVDDQQLVGVLYLLGFACESLGRQRDAVGYYQRVFAVDIEFRDVARRLSALERDAT